LIVAPPGEHTSYFKSVKDDLVSRIIEVAPFFDKKGRQI